MLVDFVFGILVESFVFVIGGVRGFVGGIVLLYILIFMGSCFS